MALLAIDNARVTFGGLHAVDGLSTSIRAGQIKGIIGPNGAGKTTLFNAIAGVQKLSGGTIRFEDQPIGHLEPYQRARLGMARTFQNLQIFADLTLLENVMIGCHPNVRTGFVAALVGSRRASREALRMEALAFEQLERFGMADRALRRAGDLSFGEAKLLEIARALAASPRMLLLDEPIAGVPSSEQPAIADTIRRINAEGVTVVLVEHNMRMVMGLCDEILVMRSGQFLAEGTPRQIASDPEVIAAYLGEELTDA